MKQVLQAIISMRTNGQFYKYDTLLASLCGRICRSVGGRLNEQHSASQWFGLTERLFLELSSATGTKHTVSAECACVRRGLHLSHALHGVRLPLMNMQHQVFPPACAKYGGGAYEGEVDEDEEVSSTNPTAVFITLVELYGSLGVIVLQENTFVPC